MTQSKFKYRTDQAGSTLFQPKKESKPFDPFDIQAASEPIIAAKKDNMEAELASIKNTGDKGLMDLDITQKNRLLLDQHNAKVQRINDEYDLEQFKSFSEGAQTLLRQGLQIRKEQQREAGYANLMKWAIEDPTKYKEWLDNKYKFDKIDGEYRDKLYVEAFKTAKDLKDPQLAAKIIDASGIQGKIISEYVLAEQISRIPDYFKKIASATPYNIAELMANASEEDKKKFEEDSIFKGVESLTYNQIFDKLQPHYDSQTLPGYVKHLDGQYRGRIAGEVVRTFKPGEVIDYSTMLEKVQPVINKVAWDGAIRSKQREDEHNLKAFSALETKRTKTILINGANYGWNYSTQKTQEAVESDYKKFPGKTEAEQRENSLIHKLEEVLKFQEEGHKWANLVELTGLYHGEVDHRSSPGKKQQFGKIYASAFEKTDFLNRALATARAQRGYKKDTRENGEKVILEAARKSVELTGSMSETQRLQLAEAGAARGYGTKSELALKILNELPTDLGRSIEQWTERIQKDKSRDQDGKLYKEDYLGAPPEVFEQEGIKDFFHDTPKYALPRNNKIQEIEYFGKVIAGEMRDFEQKPVLSIPERWSGIKAYKAYKLHYEKLIGERRGTDIADPAALREDAKRYVEEQIFKTDGKAYYTEVRPDDLSAQVEQNVIHHNQLKSSPTGRADSVVFSGTREKIEYITELQKARPGVRLNDLVPEEHMFENKEGMMVKLKDETWNNTVQLSKAGGDSRFILMQQQALKVETNQKQALPAHSGTGGEAYKRLYTTTDPKHSEALFNIKSGDNLIGKSFKNISAEEFFMEGLGVAEEPFLKVLEEMGPIGINEFYTKFLKETGLKEKDLQTKEGQDQMRTMLFNMYPEAYPNIIKDSLDKPLPITWPSILDPGFNWETIGGSL